MRTTVSLADDVVAAVERLRRERGVGLSDAVNELARRGLRELVDTDETGFVQPTSRMGARMDVANIGDVLETIDGPASL